MGDAFMIQDSEKNIIYLYKGRGKFKPSIFMAKFLLKIIAQNQPISRPDLSKKTAIPRTTLFDYIKVLLSKKRLTSFLAFSRKRGRRKVLYKLNPDFSCNHCGNKTLATNEYCAKCGHHLD